jgi:hypothetical protein
MNKMRQYFFVKEYDKEEDVHVCVDEDGMDERIKFSFFDEPGLIDFKKEDIVGKKVSVSYTEPVISMAFDARIE